MYVCMYVNWELWYVCIVCMLIVLGMDCGIVICMYVNCAMYVCIYLCVYICIVVCMYAMYAC